MLPYDVERLKLEKVLKNDGNFLFTFLKTFTGSFTTYRHSIYLYLFRGFTCNLRQLQTLLEKRNILYGQGPGWSRLESFVVNMMRFTCSLLSVSSSTSVITTEDWRGGDWSKV